MSLKKFEHIETVVLLDWFVRDFDYKFMKYQFTGDDLFMQAVIKAAADGRLILARMKQPLAEMAETLGLDLDYEAIPAHIDPPSGPWANVHYLSFGVEAKELEKIHAIQFIVKMLDQKFDIGVPPLLFKLFFLPPVPVATTDEGHVMHTFTGFANIRKRRVEINIYPIRDYESIFQTMVHEILHICFLEESSVEEAAKIETKIDEYVKSFFTQVEEEYQRNISRIHKSIQLAIEKKIQILWQANVALAEFGKELRQADAVVKTLKLLFDMILDGKIKAIPT